MKWVLVLITLSTAGVDLDRTDRIGEYDNMLDCFADWTVVDETMREASGGDHEKYKLNQQIVCIKTPK